MKKMDPYFIYSLAFLSVVMIMLILAVFVISPSSKNKCEKRCEMYSVCISGYKYIVNINDLDPAKESVFKISPVLNSDKKPIKCEVEK